jgi:hypothetical protein
MALIQVVVVLILVGVLLWAVTTYLPMEAHLKNLVVVVVVIACVLWLLSVFGLLPVGPLRVGGWRSWWRS